MPYRAINKSKKTWEFIYMALCLYNNNQVGRRLALEAADDAADGVGVGGGAAVGLRAQRRERHPLEPLGAPGVVE